MNTRVKKLREKLDALHAHAFLVTHPPHIRYLSGFSGSSALAMVTEENAILVTDGRYATQVKEEVHGWRVFITSDSLFDELQRRGILGKGWRVAFDGNTLPFATYQILRKQMPAVRFLPRVEVIESLAAVKDEAEIEAIRQAVAITDRVFGEILGLLRPGITELDIAAEISFRQRTYGAEADAFEPIIASGTRSALPHGRASSKKIKRGELVTLDFGCVFNGYHSDLTRTVAVGKPDAEARRIYSVVRDAQQRAIDAAAEGISAKELDAVARSYIRRMGYAKYFSHSLGHGLGLQIHEPPRISMNSQALLDSGNVITIEPGIYLSDRFGVRIEDDVVIRNGHCEVLNQSPKELLIL